MFSSDADEQKSRGFIISVFDGFSDVMLNRCV